MGEGIIREDEGFQAVLPPYFLLLVRGREKTWWVSSLYRKRHPLNY